MGTSGIKKKINDNKYITKENQTKIWFVRFFGQVLHFADGSQFQDELVGGAVHLTAHPFMIMKEKASGFPLAFQWTASPKQSPDKLKTAGKVRQCNEYFFGNPFEYSLDTKKLKMEENTNPARINTYNQLYYTNQHQKQYIIVILRADKQK